jgi:stearoyl-CoA desaturase (Delta-9 desaturase)
MHVAAAGPIAVEQSIDVTSIVPAASERTHTPPPATATHLIGAMVGVVMPFFGMAAAGIVSWRTGWFDLTQLIILVVGYYLTGFGVTIGYHRLLTHRSFTTYGWARAFWMLSGALAMQKSPLEWCSTHRKHHSLSDTPGDPHTPHGMGPGFLNGCRGLFHAHMGWLFNGHLTSTDHKRYVPDLLQDPLTVWVHRFWEPLFVPLTFLIPTVAAWAVTGTGRGALMGFLWGGCARVFLQQHVTFSVNSICHMFGRREYDTHDESRNNYLCGVLGAGEGFHNTHHAFPTSARHGLEWWQPDLTWYVIRSMQAVGLAWDVKLPTPEMRKSKQLGHQGK